MGAWQRGRLRLPVKQSPSGHGGSNPSAPTSHTGLAQLAERRPPKPKVRGSIPWSGASPSRRSQVVEGGGLQSRRRKPASVRIGSSSPGLVSSADESGRLLPGGSAVRVGHEAPVHFPDSAVGSAPGCYPGGPWFEATSGSQFSLISRSSVAEHRLDKAGAGGSFPPAGTSFLLGVAQMAARVIWDHEAAGSRPATETIQACAWVWP